MLDGTPVLHDLDFEIEDGTWVGLLGPNGSGKTTLLRTLSGLLPYKGHLALDGHPLRAWKAQALARQVAFVRQSTPLSFDFTVNELVLLGRSPHKGWLESYTLLDRERLQQALERVDILPLSGRSVLSLSGGERQRAFLAQALVQESRLLLLDEPTMHLDVHHQFAFLNLVRELVEAGRTVVAVFHDIALAARYADRLLVLDAGRLAAAGPPTAVLTPALLASVFRMYTELETAADGTLRIHYQTPISS